MSDAQTPSKTGITLRPVRLADAASLALLVTELGSPAPAEQIAARLSSILGQTDHHLLVAEGGNDRPVGLLHAAVVPIIETELTLQIFAMVVAQTSRRAGIGRQLVKAAEEWGRARGCALVALRCNIKRLEAHRFWAAAGYANTKTQYAFRKPLNT